MLRLGVLASGRGSNLQALIDAAAAGTLPARVVAVISDKPGAAALDRARRHGIEALFIDPKAYPDKIAYQTALAQALQEREVGLVALAGFMRILKEPMLTAFAGRIMNIHPSLLPAFPGLDAQKQALDYGVRVSGCTVHFVDAGMDTGPIILQAAVPVYAGDDEVTLSERILAEEHRLYPEAVRLFAEDRLRIDGRRVRILLPHERG